MVPGEVARIEFETDSFVSGLGFLPDGSLLVANVLDRNVLRVVDGQAEVYADLLGIAEYHLNDMFVDDRGNAYVVNFGYDAYVHAPSRPASIVLVRPDRTASRVTPPMAFPNGTVITPDGVLLTSESYGDRITAFDVAEDGTLHNQRTWATMAEGAVPDGIALDAEGALWVSWAGLGGVVRMFEGGEIVDKIETGRLCAAVAFGGEDGHDLYLCTADLFYPQQAMERMASSIERVRLEVPGAAWA
jgi:sugar lactone lactonase YvrE